MKRTIFLIMLSITSIAWGGGQLSKETDPSTTGSRGPLTERDKMGLELIKAVENNNINLAISFIEKDTNLNIQDEYFGRTALIHTVCRKNNKLAKLLIEKGANLDIKDKNNETALAWAVYYNNNELVKLLIEKGANLDIQNKNGWTALMWAAFNHNKEIFELLIEKGADTTLKSDNNKTFLYCIEDSKFEKEIIKLIESKKETIKKQISDVIPVKDLAGIVVDYFISNFSS